jgi:Cu/Zn superoxide dismutase
VLQIAPQNAGERRMAQHMQSRESMKHRLRTLAWCLALCCAFTVIACGDDDDGFGGSGGSAGSSGEGGTSGAGAGGVSGGGVGGGGTGGTMGGAGGMGGADAGDDDAGVDDDGGSEGDEITASAEIMPLDDNDITGTVTFTAEDADVSLYIELNDCVDGSYQVHVHEGAECTNFGPHWDPPRGTGITNVNCNDGHGEGTYVRVGSDPNPWSIDLGSEETDVDGHTFVVHDFGGTALACGEISVDD